MGLREGEMTMLTAPTGGGKSTACGEIAAHLLREGVKLGYIALEETVGESVLRLLTPLVDRPLHLEGRLDRSTIPTEAMDLLQGVTFLDHVGVQDGESVMSRLRFMVRGLECKFVIVDHLSIVISRITTDNERRSIDEMMAKLRSLVEETGVGLIVVVHVNRLREDDEPISLKNLRGSASLATIPNTILALEPQEENLTRVRVLKNRHTGRLGVAGYFRYWPETGRLLEQTVDFG